MNNSELSLTLFFMLLSISIGVVLVNSPLNAKAQNNVLSQNGVGAAEQETEQGQVLTQNNQVVSEDNSILSGNHLLCQSMDDPNVVSSLCSSKGIIELPRLTDEDVAPLYVTITTTTTFPCGTEGFPCPLYMAIINVLDDNRQGVNAVGTMVGEAQLFTVVDVPIGDYELYTVPFYTLWGVPENTYSGDCVQSQSDPQFCNGTMTEQGGNVKINYHFTGEEE